MIEQGGGLEAQFGERYSFDVPSGTMIAGVGVYVSLLMPNGELDFLQLIPDFDEPDVSPIVEAAPFVYARYDQPNIAALDSAGTLWILDAFDDTPIRYEEPQVFVALQDDY